MKGTPINTVKAALLLPGLVLAAPAAWCQAAPDAGSILREEQQRPLQPQFAPPPRLQFDEPSRMPGAVPSDVRFVLKGFRINGQSVYTEAELLKLNQRLIGAEVDLADLEQAAGRISRYYREHGYVVARAYLPAQDIRNGIVEITVLEGRLGRVVIENRSRVKDAVVAAPLKALEGSIVRDEPIELKQRMTQQLAGVAVMQPAELRPGQAVGETDLVLAIEPAPLATGSMEFDNYSNPFTGSNRYSGQVNVFSPLRLGDLFSLRLTRGDPGLDLLLASYQLPLGPGGLRVGGDYTHTHYRLGRDFASLEANGTAGIWRGFVSHPLYTSRSSAIVARLGYERKKLQDRVDATETVTDRSSGLTTLSINGDFRDGLGGGGITAVSLGYGIGDLDIQSPVAKAIDDLTARTNGGFRKWTLSATRLQQLSERLSLQLQYQGQQASKNLDSSEKLSLGGVYGVRAYPQGEAPGDSGYVFNAELRYRMDIRGLAGTFQPLIFIDTGAVTVNKNPFVAGSSNRRHLSAAGFGLNWLQPGGFSLRVVIAGKLGNVRATSDTDRGMRAWLQAIQQF
ncbi:MAG: ShlB/FhaC/HecB family hemolysin secretion/activation protein [Casimicrobiaceae bacterium]